MIDDILCGAFHVLIVIFAIYPIVKRHKDSWVPPADDFTPRITANADWGGVFVRIGNTPHIIVTSEKEALAMKGVRDER